MTKIVKKNKLILLKSLAHIYRSYKSIIIVSKSQIPILELRSIRKRLKTLILIKVVLTNYYLFLKKKALPNHLQTQSPLQGG